MVTTDRAPTVQAFNASVTFGRDASAVVAVHAVDLGIGADDRIALVGASGSGKSTLLHLIAGLLTPTTGELRWPRLEALNVTPGRGIGVVFQGPSLLPPLNVVENVELPLLIRGTSPDQARAHSVAALESLRLRDLASALPEELSGGQAQRVAVARVLAMSPAMICADEPTGQLDPANADLVMDVLVATADRLRVPLVVATHDERVARRLATRWSIDDGALRTQGDDRS